MHDASSKDKKNDIFETIVSVGVVVHIPVESLSELKKAIKGVPGVTPVFFTTSEGHLWIKKGDQP